MFRMKLLGRLAQDVFNYVAFIPFTFLTVTHVLCGTNPLPKPKIAECNRRIFIRKRQITKGIIMLIGRSLAPIDDLTPLIDQYCPRCTNNPTTI